MRRLFGGRPSPEDGGSKPVKANMGKKLDMYYNTEIGRWVMSGEEDKARADMADKRAPPPGPTSQMGPPSPLPSNAKQGVPSWVRPGSDHRRIQSFQPYHPPALHQLHPAQPDEQPAIESGALSGGDGVSVPPPRGRLNPSPVMGAARSSSALPPHASLPPARHAAVSRDAVSRPPEMPPAARLPDSSSFLPPKLVPPSLHPSGGGQPPSLLGQPPSLPGQPPSLPGQPPSLPGQPPSLPAPRLSADFASFPPLQPSAPVSSAGPPTGSFPSNPPGGPSPPPSLADLPTLGGGPRPAPEALLLEAFAPPSASPPMLPSMSPPALPSMSPPVLPSGSPVAAGGPPSLETALPPPREMAPPLASPQAAKTPMGGDTVGGTEEESTQVNTSPQADPLFLPPSGLERSTLPPMPADFKFGRQSRAPSNSQRPLDFVPQQQPVVVMRRASRSRIQHRSPPMSRRGTLKSDAGDIDSPGRGQPVVTFDRVAFRSKYSNTIQTLDEIFCSLLEIYAVEARKVGKAASHTLLQHFDRLKVLLPGSRSASQAEKIKLLLSNIDTETETKSSDRTLSGGAGDTLLTRQAEFMVRDIEDGLKRQQGSLEELQRLQGRVIDDIQADSDDLAATEKQIITDKWRQTVDTALRDLAEIRNEIEEITCLSSSLLGQRRMAEESFQLSILQIGREVEEYFSSFLKPKFQELMRNRISALQDEHSKAIEQIKHEMEVQTTQHERELNDAKYQFELDRIEFLNDLDKKKDEFAQMSELRDEFEQERQEFDAYKAQEKEQLQVEKQELERIESYIDEQQASLVVRQAQVEDQAREVEELQRSLQAQAEQLQMQREELIKEKMGFDAEKEYLEHEKKRLVLVSRGLEARRNKMDARQKQKKPQIDSGGMSVGPEVPHTSSITSGITETC